MITAACYKQVVDGRGHQSGDSYGMRLSSLRAKPKRG